ncbi:S1 RNA-binding domain-containing protein [Candidatus Soleaferrea massiliensis]|uniref:S1 RNA-binding domain-containing protein n=1 Tax=Candidatus Soleaferrea massiliensis TaxID=1470354 RepID=UPI00058E8C96|nr:S1 RNA-binding domain-containing protein [Candidatus Soleaferrea massiliensis]
MQLEVGKIVEGKVTGITKFGAFVELGDGVTGMVHISEVSNEYVKEIKDHLQENQMVKVKILSVSDDGKVSLSIKRALDDQRPPMKRRGAPPRNGGNFGRGNRRSNEPLTFEDMLSKFKQTSDEKMGDLKRSMDSRRGGNGGRRSGSK